MDVPYRSADGLNLYACDHGPRGGTLIPLLCLPGLTRNSKDFEAVAQRLADRRVLTVDFRGRGRSQYAADPTTYRPDVEMADTLALLDHLDCPRVAVLGTSRGGLVAMLMAAAAKPRLAGIALNDIGPRISPEGLLRIRSYLGVTPDFATWDHAAAALKATSPGFEGLAPADWLAYAHRLFRDENGVPQLDYDPRLTVTFPGTEDITGGKVPELWDFFDQVAPLPLLVLRGANSDLLSAATLGEMQRRNPSLAAVTVAGRGHVPFLDEPQSVAAIDTWLQAVDQAAA
jgi:pimeloyl-ACP methyl ester carboxylesterase